MTLTNINIVSARVGREFQNSRVTITTGERTEFGNLNVHLYRQSYISQVKTQRNLAIIKTSQSAWSDMKRRLGMVV